MRIFQTMCMNFVESEKIEQATGNKSHLYLYRI
ncbi:MAG: hypothetical protein KatS3mg033_0140 [Thermonema sp.]|nr:MAG: hypothetical protein KatS3mg033_0140 [Thermonema sp.]